MDYFTGFFGQSRDATEEVKNSAMAIEVRVDELDEALKATKAKAEEDQFEANKEIKSLKVKAKAGE